MPLPATAAPPQGEAAAQLDADASDPVALGWMIGSPPPADRIIHFADGLRFPQLRWSFSNMRQLMPTTAVPRGAGPPSMLPRAERDDIDGVVFQPIGGSAPMTWLQSIAANYTDGIVVLHQGCIVYERYCGALEPEGRHIAMSVTKAFFGTIGAMLALEGRLDADAPVADYVPELKASAFGDAKVRHLLDMTTGLRYSEDYADPTAEVWAHARAGGLIERPAGYIGAQTFHEFLQSVQKEGEHGRGFAYKTVNTDVLAWVILRVTGQPASQTLQERLWAPMGAEQDAYFTVDAAGTAFAGGGLNTCLRDLARFGETMRLGGRFNERQVVPQALVDDIRHGSDPARFAQAGYTLLPGWSYRNMWWVSNNPHGAYSARGIHGQAIYVDPKAEMVIARYASHPMASNANLDPTSLPAYHALALFLMRR